MFYWVYHRGRETLSKKNQVVYLLGSEGHVVSLSAATQPCRCKCQSVNKWVWLYPTKTLFLSKQELGQIWPAGCGLPTPHLHNSFSQKKNNSKDLGTELKFPRGSDELELNGAALWAGDSLLCLILSYRQGQIGSHWWSRSFSDLSIYTDINVHFCIYVCTYICMCVCVCMYAFTPTSFQYIILWRCPHISMVSKEL